MERAPGGRRFCTDGSISVAVQAGGFMETLYWEYPQTAGDLPFGTVVGKNIMAPLHDHLAGAPRGPPAHVTAVASPFPSIGTTRFMASPRCSTIEANLGLGVSWRGCACLTIDAKSQVREGWPMYLAACRPEQP